MFNVSDDVGYEEALLHASELMRFALTYAQGGAASVQGPHLDLIRGMAHFVEMAKDLVDKTIDKQKHLHAEVGRRSKAMKPHTRA